MADKKNILVIRLSAFGDIVRSFPTFAAIRAQHPDARLTLLTLSKFRELGEKSRFFDDIWTIDRWPAYALHRWFAFMQDIRRRHFYAVYDIQRNDRTSILRKLAPKPLQAMWFGREAPTSAQTRAGILDTSDIRVFPIPDMPWMDGDISAFGVTKPYVLLVPGSAPQHPHKRWPAPAYAAVADSLRAAGYSVVAIGTQADQDTIRKIKSTSEHVVDLCNKTTFDGIAALARQAVAAIGNDTGPMHLISIMGCPTVSVFAGTSSVSQSAPQGKKAAVLQDNPIDRIEPAAVLDAFLSVRREI